MKRALKEILQQLPKLLGSKETSGKGRTRVLRPWLSNGTWTLWIITTESAPLPFSLEVKACWRSTQSLGDIFSLFRVNKCMKAYYLNFMTNGLTKKGWGKKDYDILSLPPLLPLSMEIYIANFWCLHQSKFKSNLSRLSRKGTMHFCITGAQLRYCIPRTG